MLNQSAPLDPKLYRETLSLVQLHGVHLHELKTLCHNRVAGEVKINISTHADVSHENDELRIDTHYKIAARNAEMDLFDVEMTFAVLMNAPAELPDGFTEIFIANNLNVTVFPYVRELLASITARMGLPALTLPYVLNQYEKAKAPDKPKRRARAKKAAEF